MFSDEILIKRFGSWVKVQVAFYDFIFQRATEMCVPCWKDMAMKEVMDGFKDGEDLYERSVAAIESVFDTFETAWNEFTKMVAAIPEKEISGVVANHP